MATHGAPLSAKNGTVDSYPNKTWLKLQKSGFLGVPQEAHLVEALNLAEGILKRSMKKTRNGDLPWSVKT